MTIIVIWQESADEIIAIADSRFTSEQGVICDSAPKFSILNVVCYTDDGQDSFDRVCVNANLCIGFTGSATVALTTIAVAQAYLVSLTLPSEKPAPTIGDVADFIGRILKDNYRQFGSLWEDRASCKLILFGHLPSEDKLKAFHISSTKRQAVDVLVGELPLRAGTMFSFGSAAKHFKEQSETQIETGRFDPFGTLLEMLASESRNDVGGYLQVALASKTGVSLPHVLTPRPDLGEQIADISFLGKNVDEIGGVGQCGVGRDAFKILPT